MQDKPEITKVNIKISDKIKRQLFGTFSHCDLFFDIKRKTADTRH